VYLLIVFRIRAVSSRSRAMRSSIGLSQESSVIAISVKTPVYVTSGWDFESHSQGVILVNEQLDHVKSGYLTFWKLFSNFVGDALVFNFVINFVHCVSSSSAMARIAVISLSRKQLKA
jgi:hypothetical protein